MSEEKNHLLRILEKQILPWIRYDGISRFAYTAETLQEFRRQDLPATIEVLIKKRKGRKVSSRGPRHYGNVSVRVAHWPEDNQDILRFPTLACVLRGRADFHVGDYLIHCPERHFVLFRAGVPIPGNTQNRPHFEGNQARRICDIAWISPRMGNQGGLAFWTCHSEENLHTNNLLSDPVLVHHTTLSTVFSLFVQSVEEKMGHDITEQSLLLSLNLLRHGMRNNHVLPTVPIPQTTKPSSLKMVLQYMEEHLDQPLTIARMTQVMFVSRSTFTRQFRQITGQSFHQYLSKLRLQRAKVLLAEEAWSVNSVSQMVGMKPAQLRSLFLRETGMMPTSFREQNKVSTRQESRP